MILSLISLVRQSVINISYKSYFIRFIYIHFVYNFGANIYFSVPEDSEADIDDETQAILTSDFELGHYIRERIVPRAVLYYTGNFHKYIIINFSYD